MHSLTETFGSILSDSGFLINTEFGVLGIRPTSGPTYSNTGRPGREYTLCPGLLPALESWVMTYADGHDPMSRRSTRLIPYAAKNRRHVLNRSISERPFWELVFGVIGSRMLERGAHARHANIRILDFDNHLH
ncbi:hypothetical protein CPI83_03065 [Rhodococcus sp. H-CA8f]|nr:methionine aminopeptidase, type i [Rhodococcus erythropolis CCM2595]ATI31121.1 hypothetical protein CPI83_03065 [Rhodococcus sp. H-CA8f]SUE10649.1 methionine aminopeptidase, type i [Rhodococcus erythropolis]